MSRRTKLSESQVRDMLSENAAGLGGAKCAKKYGISVASFYNLKNKFGSASAPKVDVKPAPLKRPRAATNGNGHATADLRVLDENRRLRGMVIDLLLQAQELRAV